MKKSEYKLFFYIDDNPVNMNSKNINNNSSQQNIDIKNKLFFQDNQKNIYNKAKQKYDFYLKRNKNILLLNKKSISGKITSKDYLEGIENLDKEIKKDGLSLLPCVPNKKNNKKVEELKKLQRSTVTMRRIEYSMKVKKASNQKKYKNNIKKIIIIQKWVRGFLLRNFLSNLSYFEVFKNEFLDHLKKFVFLKHKQEMNNIIMYYQKKILIEEEKKNNYIKNKIMNHNPDDKNDSDNFNVNNINNNYNKDDNNANMISKNENEAMSFGDNLNIVNHNKKSLDVIKENSNERYIDEDSIMEYNNRNKNKINNDINNNILLLSSKDFSEKNFINSSNNLMNNDSNLLFNSNTNFNNNNGINNNNNNTPFVLNESSIVDDEGNKKLEESIKNNKNMNKNENKKETLNSNKDDIFSTLKNEEVRDVFNAKHTDNLIKPSSSLINNIINNQNDTNENNNKELIIKRPRLNKKFIEEISSAHGGTPEKKENFETKFDENKRNDNKNVSNKLDEEVNYENENENIIIKDDDEKISEENGNNVKINNYIKINNEKDSPISENEKNGKYARKINYINSLKSNQFGSISNPTNSTLDSNTLNINRKLVLDDNISIVNNNRTVLDEQNNNINNDTKFIKPINKPMIITKIRLRNDKNVEYIIIKYSKSEKKLLPKIFDINYQFSQENNEEIINSNNNKYIDINDTDGEKNKIASNEDNININIENGNNNNNNKIQNEINDSLSNININIDSNIINNTGNSKLDSNDLNINVLNVVNNNIDELNSSIKNIVKEGIPIDNKPDFQKNPFTKSIRALLELDKPVNNVSDNKGNNNENNEIKEEINDDIDENLIIENNNMSNNINNNIENNIINKENVIEVLNQMSIEEIKEVKEEYEEEKDNEFEVTQKKIYNSNNSNEIIESSKDIGSILDSNKNLIKNSMIKSQKNEEDNLIICSQNICYNILPTKKKNSFDKSLIFLMFLFVKQIKFNVKPYIFNMLKHFWIEKLKK